MFDNGLVNGLLETIIKYCELNGVEEYQLKKYRGWRISFKKVKA